MNVQEQIKAYIYSLRDPKRSEMKVLHNTILKLIPNAKLWFLDGKDEKGKIVSNPNIGYGLLNLKYSDGKSKDFYQIGISANTTGISAYLMGLEDKNYLPQSYANTIGKANVTGYCIKFKKLDDIHLDILVLAIKDAIQQTN